MSSGGVVTTGPGEEARLSWALLDAHRQSWFLGGFGQTVQLLRPDVGSGLSPVKIPVAHFASLCFRHHQMLSRNTPHLHLPLPTYVKSTGEGMVQLVTPPTVLFHFISFLESQRCSMSRASLFTWANLFILKRKAVGLQSWLSS